MTSRQLRQPRKREKKELVHGHLAHGGSPFGFGV